MIPLNLRRMTLQDLKRLAPIIADRCGMLTLVLPRYPSRYYWVDKADPVEEFRGGDRDEYTVHEFLSSLIDYMEKAGEEYGKAISQQEVNDAFAKENKRLRLEVEELKGEIFRLKRIDHDRPHPA